MKALFVGDIVGKPGRTVFRATLPGLAKAHDIDMVIVNGENAAAGFGITEKVAKELFSIGVHVITGGNHIWDKKEAVELLDREKNILRPLNYPPGVPGAGSVIHTTTSGTRVAVLNVSGRVFMQPLDCPFRTLEAELERISGLADVVIVDMHAEATSEKIAIGQYFDGKVAAIVGTHTHVQTSDNRVLPGGTAYITDAGMTGPENSVIGVESGIIFDRFLMQMPFRFKTATGPAVLCGVLLDIDEQSGLARSIERLNVREEPET